jgi:hypothetical protein
VAFPEKRKKKKEIKTHSNFNSQLLRCILILFMQKSIVSMGSSIPRKCRGSLPALPLSMGYANMAEDPVSLNPSSILLPLQDLSYNIFTI